MSPSSPRSQDSAMGLIARREGKPLCTFSHTTAWRIRHSYLLLDRLSQGQVLPANPGSSHCGNVSESQKSKGPSLTCAIWQCGQELWGSSDQLPTSCTTAGLLGRTPQGRKAECSDYQRSRVTNGFGKHRTGTIEPSVGVACGRKIPRFFQRR